MKKLEYSIKPYISNNDVELVLLFTEIHQMDLSLIKNGVYSCEMVISGSYEWINWGLEISDLKIGKEISLLTYNNDFIAELSTSELYNMLVDYHDALIEYENRYKKIP